MRRNRIGIILGSAIVASALCAGVLAQQPGAPGGGRGGAGGGQGRGGGMRGGRQLTVVGIPAAALQQPLSLKPDQVKKITDIQAKHAEAMKALMPQGGFGRRGGGGAPGAPGGAPGGQPGGGQQDFQAIFQKIGAENDKAGKDIEGVLNSDQKAKLPAVLKEFQAVRGAQIPLEVVGDLKLTPDQVKKLVAISDESRAKMMEMFGGAGRGGGARPGGAPGAAPGQPGQPGGGGDMRAKMQEMRTAVHQKVTDILTAPQKATLKKYEDAHPRPQRGGGRGGAAQTRA